MEQTTLDRFRLLRLLGTGGMGTVYEAYDTRRDLRVALKTLHRCDLAGVASLKREFRAAAQLVHPHLVQLHELVVDAELCFFTMELVEGMTLAEWVRDGEVVARAETSGCTVLAPTALVTLPTREDKRNATPPVRAGTPGVAAKSLALAVRFDERRLRRALAQLASALAFLHANGKAHRDVKPSNVLVDRDGNVKLVDFGLLLEILRPTSHDEPLIAGTLPYMAPECLRAGGGSAAANLYSLGVLAFELVTGRVPYAGSLDNLLRQHQRRRRIQPRAFNRAVPRDLDELIAGLLDPSPLERPRAVDVEERLAGRISSPGARPAPFVDRTANLAVLERALAAARSGGRAWCWPRAARGSARARWCAASSPPRRPAPSSTSAAATSASRSPIAPSIASSRISQPTCCMCRPRRARRCIRTRSSGCFPPSASSVLPTTRPRRSIR